MFSALSPLLYIKVSPDRLTVRNVKTGAEIAEVPEIAIGSSGKKKTILAVGTQARAAAASAQSAELVNPFVASCPTKRYSLLKSCKARKGDSDA
jgi:rod shape-determining protein MreB and related proteins